MPHARRVFIVEDELGAARLATELTRELGYEPEVFYSVEAFEQRVSGDPDACRDATLILDVLLPNRDAIECLFRMDRIGIALPVILVSAHKEYFAVIRSLAAAIKQRIVYTIEKPLSAATVRAALEATNMLSYQAKAGDGG